MIVVLINQVRFPLLCLVGQPLEVLGTHFTFAISSSIPLGWTMAFIGPWEVDAVREAVTFVNTKLALVLV